MNKPIKRDPSIQPLSREHHQDLLLCWKIRQGFAKRVEPARIKRYVDWFYQEHVIPHFQSEEKYLFPVLGTDHELVKKALEHHERLTHLFTTEKELTTTLNQLEEELEQHVRFEERVLFNLIQETASDEQLEMIQRNLADEAFVENTDDQFWK